MAFRGRAPTGRPHASPEALYRDLPRKPEAVAGLWLHQGDILRAYASDHTDTPDLALELPTGTGKTLPGLLIADWARRARPSRVAYACPTIQLAQQVAATADREGISNVVLVGQAKRWPAASEASYESAAAVAIVTYNTIFNSSPKLSLADLLVFDDAHAGEQYVAGGFAVTVRRRDDESTYLAMIEALAPAIDQMTLQRFRDSKPDPGARQRVRLVVPLRQPGMVERLDGVLAELAGSQAYRYSMIRSGLPACLVYLSYAEILVRPLIPPTGDNALFAGAAQRLYLSATLGEGGELERSFGRAPITRLRLPPDAATPRSGRRFFVFPELVPGSEPRRLATAVVADAGKALVLAPDTATAVATATEFAPDGSPTLAIDDVADGMQTFARLDQGTCGLAARYDGLDLPGEDCRVVVLDGKPDQDNLQERFLSGSVRAGSALAERLRTRVVQGTGRCTRGPNDWAVVVVCGRPLTNYLLSPATLGAVDPELRAEIEFGLDNCVEPTEQEVLANVRVFLEHDDAWREGGEPLIAEYRNASSRTAPPGSKGLAASVTDELEACAMAAVGRWGDASRFAQNAARTLGAGGDATRGYRALWLYLAAVWADQAAEDGDGVARGTARALLDQAEQAARPATWIREMAPLPDVEAPQLSPADTAAAVAIAAKLEAGVNAGKHDDQVEAMLTGLGQTAATSYEPALTTLGALLGAEAAKPSGSGKCDSVWCWHNALWIAVEAKSEHDPGGLISHRDIRQTNDQLRLLSSDRHQSVAPQGSATVLISPKTAVDPTGAIGAEPHIHLVHPETVLQLALNVTAAWQEILAGRAGMHGESLRELVVGALTRHSVLPTAVLERLTQQPVAST